MALPRLEPGTVFRILSGEIGSAQRPVLQCMGIKQVANTTGGGALRYRVGLSDSEHWISALLATQLNELIASKRLSQGSYVRLVDFTIQNLPSQKTKANRVPVVLQLDLLGWGEGVGDPVSVASLQPDQAAAASAPMAAGGAYGAPPRQPAGNQAPSAAPNGGSYGGAYGAPPGGAYGAPAGPAYGGPAGGAYGQQQTGGYNGHSAPQQQQQQPQPQLQPQQTSSYGNQYGRPAGGQGSYGAGSYQNGGAYGQQPQQQQQGAYGAGRGGVGASGGANQGAYGAPGGGYGVRGEAGYRAGTGPVMRDDAAPRIVPISSLNPYQARWTVKARCSQKSDVRRYSNARGEGRVFSFDLVDKDNGEIRCTGFNDQCDKFHPMIEEGKVYTLTKGSVRPKRQGNKFNNTNHECEMTLENGTTIIEVVDDQEAQAIPRMLYHFKRIDEIENTTTNTTVDVIGLVERVDPSATINKKDGTETTKRTLLLRDQTDRSVELTLWGEYASNPGEQLEQMLAAEQRPILAIKQARVGDFNGRSLSSLNSSSITIDPPDVPEAQALQQWYQSGGANTAAAPLTDASRSSGGGRGDRRVFVETIKEEQLGSNNTAAYIQVIGTIAFIRTETLSYPACTLPGNSGRACAKKLVQHNGEDYFCDRCNANSTPEWRYILSCQIADHTGQAWLTAFQEAAEQMMGGVKACDLKDMDPEASDQQIRSTCFTSHMLKMRVQEETYNDETKVKVSVTRADPIDFVKETHSLMEGIRRIEQGEPLLAPAAAPPGPQSNAGTYAGGYGNPGFGAGPAGGSSSYGGGSGYGQGRGGQAGSYATPPKQNAYGGGGGYSGGGYGGNSSYGGGGKGYGGGGF